MLSVGGRKLDHAFSVPKVGSQSDDGLVGSKAGAQQSVFVEPLDPLRIIDVGLATGHGFGVAGIDQHDLQAARLQDLVDRNPVDQFPKRDRPRALPMPNPQHSQDPGFLTGSSVANKQTVAPSEQFPTNGVDPDERNGLSRVEEP